MSAPGPGDLDPGPAFCLNPATCPHDHAVECDVCDGTGAVEAADGWDYDCGPCLGRGWIEA